MYMSVDSQTWRDYNHTDNIFCFLFSSKNGMMTAGNSSDLNQIVRTQMNVIDLARVENKKKKSIPHKTKKLNGNKSHVRWSSKSHTHMRTSFPEFVVDLKSDRKSP